ncbi:hypothetical protein Ddye_026330 [Dipteronia dyeriana]|uniref:Uncharacterized protein n=1 Tax=Dipteronia dyeriana TaxID=168575 RepID=A0AAD9WQF8_9ROSI|nr:hypothetical protein Ddye_026330 [Dipteronia dyeriana]
MATARVVIDMHDGKLTMKVLDKIVEFDLFACISYLVGLDDCHSVNMLEDELNKAIEGSVEETESEEYTGPEIEDEKSEQYTEDVKVNLDELRREAKKALDYKP